VALTLLLMLGGRGGVTRVTVHPLSCTGGSGVGSGLS
jgi:hypothetical protein